MSAPNASRRGSWWAEKTKQRWLWGFAGVLVLVVLSALGNYVWALNDTTRKVLVDTIQVVGFVGAIATVGALFMALYQLRLQRESSDAQSEAAAEQARLQRDAIEKQQTSIDQQREASNRALTEQRRATALARFDPLRRAYGAVAGAAHDVLWSETSNWIPPAGSPGTRRLLEAAPEQRQAIAAQLAQPEMWLVRRDALECAQFLLSASLAADEAGAVEMVTALAPASRAT